MQAPCGLGIEPWKFAVIQDGGVATDLSGRTKAGTARNDRFRYRRSRSTAKRSRIPASTCSMARRRWSLSVVQHHRIRARRPRSIARWLPKPDARGPQSRSGHVLDGLRGDVPRDGRGQKRFRHPARPRVGRLAAGWPAVAFTTMKRNPPEMIFWKMAPAFMLPLWLAAPLRLQAQDAQSVAERLLLDSDLPQRFTINKQIGQRLRREPRAGTSTIEQPAPAGRPEYSRRPGISAGLASLFDNDPMANMAVLSLVLYEFPQFGGRGGVPQPDAEGIPGFFWFLGDDFRVR